MESPSQSQAGAGLVLTVHLRIYGCGLRSRRFRAQVSCAAGKNITHSSLMSELL